MSDMVMAAVACSGIATAVIDLRTRRVPNIATLSIALVGLVFAAAGVSGHGVTAALLAMAFGLALMLPGHLFGATGAGDVKLFAAIAALLGPSAVLSAFLYTAIAGGLLAVVVALNRRRLAETMNGVAALVATGGANAGAIEAPTRNNRFAYAPAIAVGTLLAAAGV